MELLAGTSHRQFSPRPLPAQLKFEPPSELTHGKLALPFGLTHEDDVFNTVRATTHWILSGLYRIPNLKAR